MATGSPAALPPAGGVPTLSLYYFHLRDGIDTLLDLEGRQLDGPDAIAKAALREARGIISDDANTGTIRLDQRIEVEDAAGTVVYRIAFTDAVRIIRDE